MITSLKKNEIFVFGSNLAGAHARGAAAQASKYFGAEWDIGEGMTGQCYALPTLDKDMKQFNDEKLTMNIRRFWKCARENPESTFLLTKIGCGIAGYDEDYIRNKFAYKSLPSNIVLPKDW